MSATKKQSKVKQTPEKEVELHNKMLEQLGLSASEAKQLMTEMKKKAAKGKKQGKVQFQEGDVVDENENEALNFNDGRQRLTLGDLFESIDKKTMQGAPASANNQKDDIINTNRLQKQLKQLRKEAQTSSLTTPLTGRKRLKIERETNYQHVKKHMGKWIPQVKNNRETDQLDFTTTDVIGEGGGVKLNSMNQIAANFKESQGTSKLEKEIYDELQRQGLSSEKDLKQKEFDSLKHVDAEQLEQRYAQIASMKNLLFRQEHKNRRVAKIKSKLYHKIKKREKDREEKKLLDYLVQIDPEAAEIYKQKEEQKKVEERLRQRHASNNKFSKTLKRFGGMENQGVREAFNDMVKEKNNLKSRAKSTQKQGVQDSSDEYDDDSDEESAEDEEGLRQNAISEIEKELLDLQGEGSDGSSEEDSQDEEIEMKFDDKKKGKSSQNNNQKDKGIVGLKFMQRAEERKKEQLKEQAKMLIQQIREEQKANVVQVKEEEPESKDFIKTANKFNKKAMPVTEALSEEQIKRAAAKLQENESQDGDTKINNSNKVSDKKKKSKKSQASNVEVTFDLKEDLKNFKTEQKKIITITKEDQSFKNLFIAQDEQQAMDDFEREKEQHVEDELGHKVEAPHVTRGWNEWAGDGINENKFSKRQERAEQVKKQRIEELKKKRQDSKMKGVVLNVEERDKKFAQKYWVKDLPHPYKNVKQFEALMHVPLGKDWNTISSHKRLIQPDVLTKAGTIIKPLKYKKELPLDTIDALVQHRQEKKEKRPAAKF